MNILISKTRQSFASVFIHPPISTYNGFTAKHKYLIGGLFISLGLIIIIELFQFGLVLGGSSGGTSLAQASFSASSYTETSVKTDTGISYNATTIELSSAGALEPLIFDDPYSDRQWALNHINAIELRRFIATNENVIVAILDTGIDKYHEDLTNIVIEEIDFADTLSPQDIHGHGTHVAGIIAAVSNNGKGIVGTASGVRLLNAKVADDTGRCQVSDTARAIIWAVDNGAKVINISLEFAEPSPILESAVEYAWNKGALIITAAGNDSSDKPVYPAGYENAIAVAGLTIDDTLAPLSNYGDWVDVSAPGANIYSTLPANDYGYKTGTSFAAAYVSGIAAMLFDIASDTNGNGRVNDEVRAAIHNGCQEIGIVGVGKGRIDAVGSIAYIR